MGGTKEMITPCDIPEYDDNGRPHYHCPYAEDYMGFENEMCRNCCGLGVDEDRYPEEEYE